MWMFNFLYSTSVVVIVIALIAGSVLVLWWLETSHNAHVHIRGDVLIVFAHPDDEAMFFSPLLYYLQTHHISTHLLCLSNGNFYGKGVIRERELIKSAHVFGIQREHVHIVNSCELQDGANNSWSRVNVKQEIDKQLNEIANVSTIFTFDKYGVSQHVNHVATHNGVALVKESMPYGIAFLQLYSRPVLTKYTGICSLLYRLIFSTEQMERTKFTIVATPSAVLACWRAMRQHKSQLM